MVEVVRGSVVGIGVRNEIGIWKIVLEVVGLIMFNV